MSARIGIELAPSACRIVELDAPLRRARGAQVVEITQNAVLLRDTQGRLRRLTGGSR
jgi:hypothetical protein